MMHARIGSRWASLMGSSRRGAAERSKRDRSCRPRVDGLEGRTLLSTVTVSGRANIYGAGLASPPAPGGGGGGVLPVKVDLVSLGSPKSVTFPAVSGSVSGWAAAGGYNGPDGGGSWGGVTNVPALGGISGIVSRNSTMFLVGVFLGPNGQPAKAPATPNVTGANSAAAFSPALGQQFFIGDGRTAAKALQTFNVPAGAARLYLGFAEVLGFGYPDRRPGYYNDNGGSLTVDVQSSTAKPDIVVNTATTVDSQAVTVVYDVSAADVQQPLTFNVYRSATTAYAAANLIGTVTLPASDTANLSAGRHRVKLSLPAGALLPDPTREIITVVANPGKTVPEADFANDSAYFQIFVLGAVSHGFTSPADAAANHGEVPAWESQMAAALRAVERYDYVIPFNWVLTSSAVAGGQAVAAGKALANQVGSYAKYLESQHPGNVVDLHFIGHSRGSVVISQAILKLASDWADVIRGSYIRMTMLDPHPAANYSTNNNYMDSAGVSGSGKRAAVYTFQAIATDPNVVVPSVVNRAEVYFQHTLASRFAALYPNNDEASINLWGHGLDGTIVNQSTAVVASYDLTNKTYANIGLIGHSEVTLYYLYTVVNANRSLA